MAIQQIALVQALALRHHLTGGEHKLLIYLAGKADVHGGQIYPSQKNMCTATGFQRRHVRRILRRFEQRGWLQLIRGGRGRGKFSIYRLTLSPALAAVEQPVEIVSPFPVEIVSPFRSEKGACRTRKGGLQDHLSLAEKSATHDDDASSAITFASDPSSTYTSNVPRTTGADAPGLALVTHDESENTPSRPIESETGDRVPDAVRDRATHPPPLADDRQHRPEGDRQGVGERGRVRAGAVGDGLSRGGRDGVGAPDAPAGAAGSDADASADRPGRPDADPAAVDEGARRAADVDARRRDTFAHIDIRDFLRTLKARLNIRDRQQPTAQTGTAPRPRDRRPR